MEQTIDQQQSSTPPEKTNSFLVTLLSVLLLISVFIAGFFAYQTQNLVKKLATTQLTPSPTVTTVPTQEPIIVPSITSPLKDGSVSSPLVVTGFVPQGWMFEGIFPIKIVDSNRKLIKQASAKETIPGSWSTEENIEFTSTISYTTSATSGYIVLENDNPSGLPENHKSFEIPIFFNKNPVACTMEAKICPDGSSVGRSGPNCEFAPCATTSPQL